MRRMMLAAALLAALGACGQREPEAPQHASQPRAATATMSIGPDGAGGITAPLAMSVTTVRSAAPHFVVAAVEGQIEGQPFTAIGLSQGGEEVFRILPTADGAHIHSIVTRSAQARGPLEEVVGQSLFAAAPADEVPFCQSETLDGAPGFACALSEDASFWRVYRLPEGYDGPSDPFDAIDPDVLHDATLVEMRWIAPRTTLAAH